MNRCWVVALVLLVPGPVSLTLETPQAIATPNVDTVRLDTAKFSQIDLAVNAAIAEKQLPGAVVVIVHRGEVIFKKAFGQRAVEPAAEPMTTDTIFDLASLTKPIATATSIMLLVERGKLQPGDCVAKHLPRFGQNGKEKITVEQLLLHTSGLIADNPLKDYEDGPEKALERIDGLTPLAAPGEKFIYSDVNYIVLGELTRALSGKPLDEFVGAEIFAPLGMKETGFKPAESLRSRIAPTEKRGEQWLRGEVHDPRSAKLGGVAGHAGLFSTADDLTRYVQLLLGDPLTPPPSRPALPRGERGGRFLKPETLRLMTQARPVPGGQRAYGWDVDTRFSANRGERFPVGKSYGHTGFTGTSLWIDPTSQTAVIFLSNRLHPDGKGNVNKLRGRVATIAAEAVGLPPLSPLGRGAGGEGSAPAKAKPLTPNPSPQGGEGDKRGEGDTLCGVDVLVRAGFKPLQGKRVGLVTNHTGVARDGTPTIDLLHKAPGVQLVALFSPEHGIRGALDAKVADGKDEKTGLPIYSLYGERRRPTAEQLRGLDVLVFDIQDIGCRFYTYITTLGYVLEAAAEHKLKVVVLDRPNPIGGVVVQGPVLDAGSESFIAYHRLPIRHGMTVGELARLFNGERKIGVDLEVVKLEGWRRDVHFDRTGMTWVNPSPNMRCLAAALLYPGIGLLETTNVSVGRGTDRPFEQIGAPWLDGPRLAAALRERSLPGVRFVPARFTPTGSTHAGKECGGVQIFLDDWSRFDPLLTGMTIACELKRLHPNDWQTKRYPVLLGHKATFEALENGKLAGEIVKLWADELREFSTLRAKYLIYE